MGYIRITSINAPWRNDCDRRGMAFQVPNLDRGRVCAEHCFIGDIKRVMHRTSGMILGDVKCFKVMEVVLYLRAVCDIKPGPGKDLFDPPKCSGYGMQGATVPYPPGKRDVYFFGRDSGLSFGREDSVCAPRQCIGQLITDTVDCRTKFLAGLRWLGPNLFQLGCHGALAPEQSHPQLLYGRGIVSGSYVRKGSTQ